MARQKLDSLIETIRRTMLSETQRDVSFIEHSWWSQLLRYEGKGRRVSNGDLHFRKHKGKKLIIAHYFVDLFRIIIMGVLWVIYALVDLVRMAVVGRKQNESQTDDGDKESWWKRMRRWWRDREKESASIWVNFVLLAVFLVIAIVFLVFILSFAIRSIVLPPSKMYVNNSGVVSIEQPHMEEHHFFLLNAATAWTQTDIRVSRGDKVYITASGGLYCDIGEMVEKAKANDTLLYPRYSYAYGVRNSENIQYCIYGRNTKDREDARFGSLLYQIRKQHLKPKDFNGNDGNSVVRQVDFDTEYGARPYYFKVQDTGVLFFSFNDILLDIATLNNIIKNKPNKLYHDLNESYKEWKDKNEKDWENAVTLINNLPRRVCIYPLDLSPDSTDKVPFNVRVENGEKGGGNDSDIQDDLIFYHQRLVVKDPKIWFKDNLGEVLINVRVEKSICNSSLPWYKKVAVWFYRHLDHFFHSCSALPCCPFNKAFIPRLKEMFSSSCIPLILSFLLLVFIVDVFVSNRIRKNSKDKTAETNKQILLIRKK